MSYNLSAVGGEAFYGTDNFKATQYIEQTRHNTWHDGKQDFFTR